MKGYFIKNDIIKHIEELKTLTVGSDKFRLLGLKVICSYSKPLTLTKKGLEHGMELWNKYKTETKVPRKDLFKLSLLSTEAALFEDVPNVLDEARQIHNKLEKTYDPEDEYIDRLVKEEYVKEGYLEDNPNFIKEIYERMDTLSSDIFRLDNIISGLREFNIHNTHK